MTTIKIFLNRMKRIGIDLELAGNYPWIYITKINGIPVIEKFYSNHGFTLAFSPVKMNSNVLFTDLKEVFKLIRKYKNKSNF